MKVFYTYKGEMFDDIRDIVENNKKLQPNWDYIFFEYMPYQVFLTGRTFFKDVYVQPNVKYDPVDQFESKITLEEVMTQYLEAYEFSSKSFAAAVSGGVDSSSVALLTEPMGIYTGYYDEPGYDEREYSEKISEILATYHVQLEVTEKLYLAAIDGFLEAVCSPIAGMGGVSEYLVLSLAKELLKADSVFFGNGGDEVFCGYFYNHIIDEMVRSADEPHEWMDNFAPTRKRFVYENINTFINMLNYRGSGSPERNPFDRLKGDYVDKMLSVNINYTLPSLLHINQQMCLANGVKGYNPLSSEVLIKHAKMFNSPISNEPKAWLKGMVDLPPAIKNRKDKMGFPIPVHKWAKLNELMREAYDSFITFVHDNNFGYYDIREVSQPYDGINRRTWGIFMIERWRRLFT